MNLLINNLVMITGLCMSKASTWLFSILNMHSVYIIPITIWIIFNKFIHTTLRLMIFKSSFAAQTLLLSFLSFYLYLKFLQTYKHVHAITFALYLYGSFFRNFYFSQFFCHLLSDLSKKQSRVILDSSLSLTTSCVVSYYLLIHHFIFSLLSLV